MSLTVRILEFRLPKPKANLIGRVEFRGKLHWQFMLNKYFSSIHLSTSLFSFGVVLTQISFEKLNECCYDSIRQRIWMPIIIISMGGHFIASPILSEHRRKLFLKLLWNEWINKLDLRLIVPTNERELFAKSDLAPVKLYGRVCSLFVSFIFLSLSFEYNETNKGCWVFKQERRSKCDEHEHCTISKWKKNRCTTCFKRKIHRSTLDWCSLN